MPAIPESTRGSITWRLILHAEKNWPQLAKVQVSYRGSFAYITGTLPGGEQIPLFRLRYGGSAHSFGFAIYSAAHDRYEDAALLTGLPVGTPQEALDTACTAHLAALGHEPPQDLRRRPLKFPVDAGHHGVGPVTLFQQQAAQPAQVRDRVSGRGIDQVRDLAEPEAEPPVGEHVPQALHVARLTPSLPMLRNAHASGPSAPCTRGRVTWTTR